MGQDVVSGPSVYARLLALSFLTGTAVMTAELAAPRLAAPQLGSGLLTWSSIFAVFLGGLAVGNWIGGRLADRAGPRTLPALFLISGLALALAVPLEAWLQGGLLDSVPAGVRTLMATVIAFGPGALAVGTIAPALGRSVLAVSAYSGRALGAVSAAGAVGSVFGTLITGFLLVPNLGTRVLYLGAGALLLLCLPMAATIPPGGRRATTPSGGAPPRGFAVLAALAGGALLVIEVIATRVAANRLGTSVYTWTAVIGVVLIGLGVGNALGGRLADRFAPRRLLASLFLAASVATAACLWTPTLMTGVAAVDGPWMLRTLLAVGVAFFLPALAIGTLTPVIIRAALKDPLLDGRVIGHLYAIGTAGAVVGSLLTGYVLIPLLQVPLLITLLALGLALAAWRLGGRAELPWIGTLVVVALLSSLPFEPVRVLGRRVGVREDGAENYVEDSRYFHIGVESHDTRWVRLPERIHRSPFESDPRLHDQVSFDARRNLLFWKGAMSPEQLQHLLDGMQEPGNLEAVRRLHGRTKHDLKRLSLDRFVHGFVDLEDPLWLEYEYEILQGALVRVLWPAGEEPINSYFIGGGAYTFQRRLLNLYPDRARVFTAEIDPAVTRVATEQLGLVASPNHRIFHEDARTALRKFDGAEGAKLDLVFGDAFHDLGVPWHLTTREFAAQVKTHMQADGVYIVNMIDVFASGRFLGAFLKTLESVFDEVRVLSMGPRDDRAQSTFLLLASDTKLTWGRLVDDAGLPLDVIEYGPADREAVKRRAQGLVLTDDHAPVENLLAPVVRLRASGRLRTRD